MSDKTKIQIENIYSSAKQILSIYNLLKKFELMNTEKTSEYKMTVDFLNLVSIAEKSLYDYFIKNPSEVIHLVKHIIEDTIHLQDCNNIDLIIKPDVEDLISMRVKNQINNRIVNVDYNSCFESIINRKDNLNGFIKILNDSTDIRMISFLEKQISKVEDKDMKNHLISAKLCLSYLNEKVEEINLKNNFGRVPNKFNQDLEFNTTEKDKIKDMKNLHGELLLVQGLGELEEYDDKDLISPEIHGRCIICEGLIQSSLLYFSRQQAKMMKIFLDNKIEKLNESSKEHDEEKRLIDEIINFNSNSEDFDEEKYFIEEIIEEAFSSIDNIKKDANSDLPKEKSL
ncbi:MAG: hypothetical protein PHG03_01405 [Bacilli bacterium]|nr:hypothetical protein [Bacilli bacterium]